MLAKQACTITATTSYALAETLSTRSKATGARQADMRRAASKGVDMGSNSIKAGWETPRDASRASIRAAGWKGQGLARKNLAFAARVCPLLALLALAHRPGHRKLRAKAGFWQTKQTTFQKEPACSLERGGPISTDTNHYFILI